MACIIVLKIFEFLVNLATLLRFRVANIESCSNNQNVFVINYILNSGKSNYCARSYVYKKFSPTARIVLCLSFGPRASDSFWRELGFNFVLAPPAPFRRPVLLIPKIVIFCLSGALLLNYNQWIAPTTMPWPRLMQEWPLMG